jgi:HEAT repeat protein
MSSATTFFSKEPKGAVSGGTGLSCGVLSFLCLTAWAWGLDKEEPLYRGQPIAYWAEALKTENSAARREAVNALGTIGPEAKKSTLEAVPSLLEMVKDPALHTTLAIALGRIGPEVAEALCVGLKPSQDVAVREGVAKVLGRLGAKAKNAIPSLVAALKDDDTKVQTAVADALSKIGVEALGPLSEALATDPNALVRAGAARALARVSPRFTAAVPALTEALKDKDPSVRLSAAVALAAIKPKTRMPKEIVVALLARLGDKTESVNSSQALGAIVPDSAAIPELLAALDNPDSVIRANLARGLGSIGADAVQPLTEALKSNRPIWVREGAARALGQIVPKAKDAIPSLKVLVQDPNAAVAFAAVVALTAISQDSKDTAAAVGPVLAALNDRDTQVRNEAAGALRKIVPGSADVPRILQALNTTDYTIATVVTEALRKTGASGVGPLLREFQRKENDPRVRIGAARALGILGALAKNEAVPVLAGAIKEDSDPSVRYAAAVALGKIDPASNVGVEMKASALNALKDLKTSYSGRLEAVDVLGRLLPRKAAVPALVEALTSMDYSLRNAATTALRKIGAAAVEPLLEELKPDRRSEFRLATVQALGNLGPQAKAAVPKLLRALEEENPSFNAAVITALTQIGISQPAAVPALLSALNTPEVSTRETLVNALARVGEPAVEELRGALKSKQGLVRAGAAKALGRIGRPAQRVLSDLTQAMQDRDQSVSFAATVAWGTLVPIAPPTSMDAKSIEALLEGVKNADYLTRQEALGVLGRVVPEAVAIHALVARLRTGPEDVRQAVGSALAARGKTDPMAVQEYLDAFRQSEEKDVAFRGAIADILFHIGPPARETVPALVEVLEVKDKLEGKDRANFPRYVMALGAIGPDARAALPALSKAIESGEPILLRAAVEAVGRIGPDSEVKRQLLKAITRDSTIRSAAIKVLGKITPVESEVEAALSEALKDESWIVRVEAAVTLGTLGRKTKEAVKVLVEIAEKSAKTNPSLHGTALKALGVFGPEAKGALPVLTEALINTPDSNSRESVADLLGDIGPEAQDAVPALRTRLLQDIDPSVRRKAAAALGTIGLADSKVIEDLSQALKDPDPRVGQQAAAALGQFRQQAKDAIPHLVKALGDPRVRLAAVDALGRIGVADKEAVQALLRTLVDPDKKVHEWAHVALARIGKDVVPDLQKALTDDNRDVRIRAGAAAALGEIGVDAKKAVPALVAALSSSAPDVGTAAAYSLGKIVVGLYREDKEEIRTLQTALDTLKNMKPKLETADAARLQKLAIDPVQRKVDSLQAQAKESTWSFPTWTLWPALFALYFVGWHLLWLALLWLRPLWLLRINDTLRTFVEVQLPPQLGGLKISLRDLLLVRWFNYRPRVLDAWVAGFLPTARERFEDSDTVKDRQVYVDAPVDLDRVLLPDLTAKHLQRPFGQKQRCLLIWGEGGSGKTALVCQVAKWAMAEEEGERLCKHRMLPILIEQELDYNVDPGNQPFLEAIRGQLRLLIGELQAIPPELLDCLLRQRRLLVIVDHFSEMSDATRRHIRPGDPTFPANALVVTSRVEENLDGVPKTVVKPQRIQGNNLSSFMEAYLAKRGRRSLFPDQEYFAACSRLSQMVGTRNITVLLAKLFAEQMIALKLKEQPAEGELPDNIPDLMLSYLNELNRGAGGADPDDRAVHEAARIIAWECLRGSLRPADAPREAVRTALGEPREPKPEDRTQYLEKRLRLIRTIGPARDQIRFALDPLAEYLAGLHLVREYGSKEDPWRELLQRGRTTPGGPEGIKGFLLAVRDCCFAKGGPSWVVEELGRLAGLGGAAGAGGGAA